MKGKASGVETNKALKGKWRKFIDKIVEDIITDKEILWRLQNVRQ